MQIPVLIEPIDGKGFQARGAELCAQGATREEALRNLHEQIQARIRQGAAIVPLEVGAEPHPLAEFAGMFKDDPRFADWKKSMAEYRRQIDEAPDLP
jgi:hypothetical protein